MRPPFWGQEILCVNIVRQNILSCGKVARGWWPIGGGQWSGLWYAVDSRWSVDGSQWWVDGVWKSMVSGRWTLDAFHMGGYPTHGHLASHTREGTDSFGIYRRRSIGYIRGETWQCKLEGWGEKLLVNNSIVETKRHRVLVFPMDVALIGWTTYISCACLSLSLSLLIKSMLSSLSLSFKLSLYCYQVSPNFLIIGIRARFKRGLRVTII